MIEFNGTMEQFFGAIESIGYEIKLKKRDSNKCLAHIQQIPCNITIGKTFATIFYSGSKAQFQYKSKNNTKENIAKKIDNLFMFNRAAEPTKTHDEIKLSESYLFEVEDYIQPMFFELGRLGCIHDPKLSRFVAPSSKQSNINEVLNHYSCNRKGMTPSQKTDVAEMSRLLPLDVEFKKTETGLWLINTNTLATKEQIKSVCKKRNLKIKRTVNGIRYLLTR